MTKSEPSMRFRFGPLEKRGLLAGWRTGQAAAIGVGLVISVAALRMLSTAPAIAVSLIVMSGAVGFATWPVAGRTGDEWLPDVARHGRRMLFGRTWRAPMTQTVERGRPMSADRGPKRQRNRRSPRSNARPKAAERGPFSTLRIIQPDSNTSPSAVIYDPFERTYTAVMPASGPGFVLLGPGDRDRRVSGWSAALSVLSRQGSPVHRLQWVARTLPGVPGQLENTSLFDNSKPDATRRAARASYEEMLASASPLVRRHQVLIAMSIKASRTKLGMRPPGPAEHAASCAVLQRELTSFRRRLSDADVSTAAPLTPRALASAIRAGFSSSRWGWPEECSTGWPWPVASEVLWDAVRVDGTWHATFWIAEWPRTDVNADFLSPLLLAANVRQAVSVTMEPLSPLEAARKAEQARTADVADAELRRKGGFLRTARRKREEETLASRESELADGHGSFRFSGYVTVSADTKEELEDSCGRTEQAAGQCGMELRRCYGDQQRAFSFTLPLGRGIE